MDTLLILSVGYQSLRLKTREKEVTLLTGSKELSFVKSTTTEAFHL